MHWCSFWENKWTKLWNEEEEAIDELQNHIGFPDTKLFGEKFNVSDFIPI